MSVGHIVKFHLLLPAAIFGLLFLVGFSLQTAVVAGMMAGCMSMVFMMGGDSRRREVDETEATRSEPPRTMRS